MKSDSAPKSHLLGHISLRDVRVVLLQSGIENVRPPEMNCTTPYKVVSLSSSGAVVEIVE
jgi:hypothetical protein